MNVVLPFGFGASSSTMASLLWLFPSSGLKPSPCPILNCFNSKYNKKYQITSARRKVIIFRRKTRSKQRELIRDYRAVKRDWLLSKGFNYFLIGSWHVWLGWNLKKITASNISAFWLFVWSFLSRVKIHEWRNKMWGFWFVSIRHNREFESSVLCC